MKGNVLSSVEDSQAADYHNPTALTLAQPTE